MGRSRIVKADFFRSRSLARCGFEARLTYIGLWLEADDAGRGVADPRILKGSIWPLDDEITPDDIAGHLHELCREHIRLYKVDGEAYYEVLKWEKHQAASYRRGEAKHPAPPMHNDACNKVQAAPDGVLEVNGREGNRRDDDAALVKALSSSSVDAAVKAVARTAAEILCSRRKVSPDHPSGWKRNTAVQWAEEHRDEIVPLLVARMSTREIAELLTAEDSTALPPRADLNTAHEPCPRCDDTGRLHDEDGIFTGPCVHPLASVTQLRGAG